MGIKVVATNRKATHDYSIIDKYESGMVLTGSEIKSIRNSRVTIKQAYVRIYSNELYIVGMNISDYENAGYRPDTGGDGSWDIYGYEEEGVLQNILIEYAELQGTYEKFIEFRF